MAYVVNTGIVNLANGPTGVHVCRLVQVGLIQQTTYRRRPRKAERAPGVFRYPNKAMARPAQDIQRKLPRVPAVLRNARITDHMDLDTAIS